MAVKKKKITPHKATKKVQTRRTSPKATVSYRRIILISTAFVMLLFMVVTLNKRTVSKSVAGLSITRGLYNQGTVSWQPVNGAVAYNLYYKQQSDPAFYNAVRRIPANITSYTVSYLKKDTHYQYQITALNAEGKEFWFSPILYINNLTGM